MAYAFVTAGWVGKQDAGNTEMKTIASKIQEGAMAFLSAEYKVLALFVIIVAGVLSWGAWNLTARPFEPYPVIIFAVVSGVLSTLAAAQGPLVLMAQRRAAMNDRARDEENFRVVTHSEADLHLLTTKVDELAERIDRLASRD